MMGAGNICCALYLSVGVDRHLRGLGGAQPYRWLRELHPRPAMAERDDLTDTLLALVDEAFRRLLLRELEALERVRGFGRVERAC